MGALAGNVLFSAVVILVLVVMVIVAQPWRGKH